MSKVMVKTQVAESILYPDQIGHLPFIAEMISNMPRFAKLVVKYQFLKLGFMKFEFVI